MSGGEETHTVSTRSNLLSQRTDATGPDTQDLGPPPVLSSRYRVDDRLGRGGVGVVYRGWDEELDRPVAIKVLRPDRTAKKTDESVDLATRLRQESMALAALSHPNVVAVYDVVEGPGGVGIVMEMIDGVDLRSWLRESEPSIEEVLGVYAQAGRGLDAAHAEGFVHRDFKPGNVMLGADGRVRVLDFGLARLVAAEPMGMSRHSGQHVVLPRALATGSSFTDHGAVMGTPAYMAPEQIEGGHLDARSDQFSFCVALYEALSRRRPFEGPSLRERKRAIAEGAPPLLVGSRRLRDAVGKGLARDPDQRHPSMRELIAVLEAELRPSSGRRWLAGVGIVGVSAAVGLSMSGPDRTTCAADDPRTSSWTDGRRSALAASFLAVDAPFVGSAWSSAEAEVDAYVERWVRERDAVCNAETPDPVRTRCLAQVHARFDAALDVFAKADADVVEHAVAVLRGLPDPAECEPAAAERFADDELAAVNAHAIALADTRHYEDALAEGRKLLAMATARDNAAYQALGLLRVGLILEEMGAYEDAAAHLQDAYFAALRVDDVRAAVEAALAAGSAVGMGVRRVEEGRTWIRHARTTIERLERREILTARAATIEGGILMMGGKRDEGLALLEESYAIYVEVRGENDPDTVNVLNNIGLAYQELGRFDEALAKHQRALEIFTALMGPEHPSVAHANHAIAATLSALNRPDEAIEKYRLSIEIWEKRLAPEHPTVAMAHYNIGYIHQMEDRSKEALKVYLHAIGLLEQSLGRDHFNTAMAVHNAGSVHHDLAELEQAQALLERSLAVFESTDANPLYLAVNRYELATVLHERGVQPHRVTALIKASRSAFDGDGAFERSQRETVRAWIEENRPDLAEGTG